MGCVLLAAQHAARPSLQHPLLPEHLMPSLNALRNFYRAQKSSLYTFVMLAAERVLQMGIGLWIASQIARHHDQATFASWQIAMSLWLVFGSIGNVTGERVLLPRLCAVSDADRPRLWHTAIAAKLISGVLTALALAAWAATMPDPRVLAISLLWALQLVINMPVSMLVHEAYARDDFRRPQMARIASMLCRFGVVAAVLWLNGPIQWLVWGWIVEISVFAVLLRQYWLPRSLLQPGLVDTGLMKTLFAQGAALSVAASASVALTRVDRLALGKHLPADVLSQYAAAMTLLEAAFSFAAMLATIVGAKTLFRPGPINVRHHAGIAVFALGISSAVTLLLYAVAPPLMTTIYGASYAESAVYLRIAAGLLPLVFVQAILQAPLLARATKRFHLIKALSALGAGAAMASWAAHHGHYTWISAGAYGGYLTLILFDLRELYRRRRQIYGDRP